MNYKIKVYKTKNNEWNTKAYVSVTFNDCFIVTGITVTITVYSLLCQATKAARQTKKGSQYTGIIAIQPQSSSETNFMETLLMPITMTGRNLK